MSIEPQKRKVIEQQIADLTRKATERPTPNDPMGMIGFGSVLLAAQMQVCLLRADFIEQEEEKEQKIG